jgi:hypothetical protein
MPSSSIPPVSYEYVAFAVLTAETVKGPDPLIFVAGIPKASMEEYCEQHTEYTKADSPTVALEILKSQQNEITIELGNDWVSEIKPLTIQSFQLPPTLPKPKFEISNGQIPVWDNQDLGAILNKS